jgi:hypothetical protein
MIDSIEVIYKDARRLLNQGLRLSCTCEFGGQESSCDSIVARLTKDTINLGLKNAGLPPATLLKAAAVVQTATSEVEASLLMGPAITVGVTFAVSILFCWSGCLDGQGFATNQRHISPNFVSDRLVGYSL